MHHIIRILDPTYPWHSSRGRLATPRMQTQGVRKTTPRAKALGSALVLAVLRKLAFPTVNLDERALGQRSYPSALTPKLEFSLHFTLHKKALGSTLGPRCVSLLHAVQFTLAFHAWPI